MKRAILLTAVVGIFIAACDLGKGPTDSWPPPGGYLGDTFDPELVYEHDAIVERIDSILWAVWVFNEPEVAIEGEMTADDLDGVSMYEIDRIPNSLIKTNEEYYDRPDVEFGKALKWRDDFRFKKTESGLEYMYYGIMRDPVCLTYYLKNPDGTTRIEYTCRDEEEYLADKIEIGQEKKGLMVLEGLEWNDHSEYGINAGRLIDVGNDLIVGIGGGTYSIYKRAERVPYYHVN